jgi:membrane protease YdiL (CAAX protease family)
VTGGAGEASDPRRVPARVWLGYIVLLYALWAWVELGLDGLMAGWWGQATASVVHSLVVKPAIWAVPAIALIVYCGPAMRVRLPEMWALRRRDWPRILAAVAALTAYVLLAAWPRWSAQGYRLDVSPMMVARVLVSVGLCEELAFRGWLLNAMPGWRTWWGYLLNGALFMGIHAARWIGQPNQHGIGPGVQTALFLVVFGAAMAWLFARTRSLLASLIPHAWYDLMVSATQ